MKIVLYGRLADLLGRELHIESDSGCSVVELRARIIDRYPGAQAVLLNRRVRACVGNELVEDDYVVQATDCVEFLAPVSGG